MRKGHFSEGNLKEQLFGLKIFESLFGLKIFLNSPIKSWFNIAEVQCYSVWEKGHSGFGGIEDRSEVIFSVSSVSELFVLCSEPLIDDDNLPSDYSLDFKNERSILLHYLPILPSYCPT